MNFALSCLSDFINGVLANKEEDEIKREIIKKAESQVFNTTLAKRLTDEVRNALTSLGYRVIDVVGRVNYKAISGLSSGLFHLIFEVGLNYDEILDLPYIPGSTIKGVLRNRLYELTGGDCKEVFGGKEFEGSLFVSDAYPVEGERLLVGDIINPHYTNNVKTEYDVKPTPILHLAVRENVKFRFLIGVEKGARLCDEGRKLGVSNAVELVSLLLLYSMKTGLGARSTKGYNFFDVERIEVV